MASDPRNVLLPMRLPTQKSLRAAVANVIRDIQRDHAESDNCTADRLGISVGTVRNARNETTDLNALTIARIGAVYGPHYLDPYNNLYGATATLVNRDSVDPLAHMAKAVSQICDMRCPNGPGGVRELPQEQFEALPDLRAAYASLGAYIGRIERLRLVA